MADLEKALRLHAQWRGKIEVNYTCPMETREDLSMAYTPGVAEPCKLIAKDTALSYTYTRRGNLVAVVTDGSAVLGLGDIGPEAGMPVMEGKCALFKAFADVDAFPLCIRSHDVDEIVRTVSLLAGSFGGINLEDISAPRCFEIEEKLKEICDIPVFHDDQHGTAIVVAAALFNALKITEKKMEDIHIVISGAGAAGTSIAKLLLHFGAQHIIMSDINGAVYAGRPGNDVYLEKLAQKTNLQQQKGTLAQVLKGADVFIGVSAPGIVSADMVAGMAAKPIIFAMANPVPEIDYHEALAAGAAVVGTGRSDYPNQINNVLAFPGVFRGALDARAADINNDMKVAAAKAIAAMIPQEALHSENIIPNVLDKAVAQAVAQAVRQAAVKSGVANIAE